MSIEKLLLLALSQSLAVLGARADAPAGAPAPPPREARSLSPQNPPGPAKGNQDYTLSFAVSRSPEEVFAAITQPRRWWSEAIEGDTAVLGAVFHYHFRELHRCTLKLTELTPGKRVVWHVLRNEFSFVKNRNEWTGTDIVFEITRKGAQTELRFTHLGLLPDNECYGACSEGWHTYIAGSLRRLIETGQGQPNVGEALTEHEQFFLR